MVNLTTRLCWKLVKKEGYIAIWQKPLNNSCYLSREEGSQPPLCDPQDDPDNVWWGFYWLCLFKFYFFPSTLSNLSPSSQLSLFWSSIFAYANLYCFALRRKSNWMQFLFFHPMPQQAVEFCAKCVITCLAREHWDGLLSFFLLMYQSTY